MLNLIPTQYKILAGMFALTIGLGVAYWAGWDSGNTKYLDYKARVEQTAAQQAEFIKRLEHERQEALDESVRKIQDTTDSINSYYRSHPVIRVRDTCSASGVPETASNPQGADDTSATLYASPYRPDDTEQVANRLDQLQKLLKEYNVTIK